MLDANAEGQACFAFHYRRLGRREVSPTAMVCRPYGLEQTPLIVVPYRKLEPAAVHKREEGEGELASMAVRKHHP